MLVVADATDPVTSGSALAAPRNCADRLSAPAQRSRERSHPFQIRIHARYNPAAVTQFNVVPGLVERF